MPMGEKYMGRKGYDLRGQRFERLYAIEKVVINHNTYWKCQCDCGNIAYAGTSKLLKGKVKSCGCYKREKEKLPKKHGLRRARIYAVYYNMLGRCKNPSAMGYKNYGERGITVCDEWKNSFEIFYKWAMENGYTDELTIERIDVNGNYEPSNCCWVTRKQQMNNKTTSHFLTYKGETHTMAEWSEITGINYGTLSSRINKLHWSVEDSLTKTAM